jgi:hypothetical protein
VENYALNSTLKSVDGIQKGRQCDSMQNETASFAVTFAHNQKIILASITVSNEKTVLKRSKPSQSLGYHIPASNDNELKRCAEYLSKESAAVSAVCNGYAVVVIA